MSAQKSWTLVFEGRHNFFSRHPAGIADVVSVPEIEHSVTFAGSVSPAF